MVHSRQPSLRWLHLSDFHFGEAATLDQENCFEALKRQLRRLCDEGLQPDLVFVTGDLTYRGTGAEFSKVEVRLADLAACMALTDRERWFVVPGNHDVERSRIGFGDAAMLAGLREQQDVERLFGDAAAMKILGRRLQEFYAFTGRFLGADRAWQVRKPWRSERITMRGVEIGILQLNSSWASGREQENGHLVTGEAQVEDALSAVRGAALRIALVHHPLWQLREWDFDSVRELLGSQRGVGFLLRGHRHQNRLGELARPHDGFFELATGASYTRDKYYTGFQLVDLDLDAGQAMVRMFRYAPEAGGFWAPDTLVHEEAPNGIVRLALRRAAGEGGVHQTVTARDGTLEEERVADPAERGEAVQTLIRLGRARGWQLGGAYRVREGYDLLRWRPGPEGTERFQVVLDTAQAHTPEQLLALQGRLRLPAGHGWEVLQSGPHVRAVIASELGLRSYASGAIADFDESPLAAHYIDLWAREPGGRELPVHEFLREWLADPLQVHLTLVGEYGAGKTSLTRWWTRQLAEAFLADPGSSRAPVRIDLRSAAGERKTEDLVRVALGASAERISDDLLHLAIEQGLLVILLDGFDEMAARPSEKQIVDSYVQLSQLARGPRSKVLFTCRTSSFSSSASFEHGLEAVETRASRLGVTHEGFRRATLLALRSEQITAYLERRIKEGDRRERLRRRIASLYNLQDLSTRPLLLEMIVSVSDDLLQLEPGAGAGGDIYRASLYRMFTDLWVHRHDDVPSRRLRADQKEAISLHLARSLWDQDFDSLPLESPLRAVAHLLPGDPALPDLLAEAAVEVRTASFLVREGESRLRFAHKSFLEYFLARDIFLRLDQGREDALPERFISEEVAAFLHEMLMESQAEYLLEQLETRVRSRGSDCGRVAALVASYRVRRVARAAGPAVGDLTAELARAWGPGLSLAGAHLEGLDLSYAALAGADLAGAHLAGSDLRGAVLSGADLRGAHLVSLRADGARLDRARLAGAELDEASLAGADLSGADLRRARLRAARLDDADLRAACLDGARLRGARLRRTDLCAASARDAELDATLISAALLDGLDLAGASLAHAALHDTDLRGTSGVPRTIRGAALAPRRPRRIELPQPPWRGGGATPSAVCWAPDGARYGVASWDGVVRLFDAKLARLLAELPHEQAVRRIAFSPDGMRLLTACHDGWLRLWSLEEERELLRCGRADTAGRAISCSFSADGRRIAGGWSNRTARVFDAARGTLVAELWHERQVRDCAFATADGLVLVTACADGHARLWDVDHRRTVRDLQNGTARLRTCAVSPDGRLLATGSEDLQVRLFDLSARDDRPAAVLEHEGPLWSCTFSRDGRQLATGAEDGKARVFPVSDPAEAVEFEHGGWVWSCAFSPDGSRLLTCCDDGTVRTFVVATGRLERVVPHGRWVRSAAVSPDSRTLVAACNDRAARVFGAETGRLRYEKEHGGWVRSCAISPDGSLALTIGADGQARLFQLADGTPKLPPLDHGQRARACCFAPDGLRFATGRADGTVRIYATSGQLLQSFELKSEVWTLAFTSDGGRVLAGCHDGRVCLAEVESARTHVLDKLDGWVRACACSPGVLAAGRGRWGLRLWDARTLEKLPTLPHRLECWNVSFSPDGSRLLTAWADSVVRCHEVGSLAEIAAIRHPGWAWTCSFFPDGERILTGCDDGRLRVYALPERTGGEPELRLTIAAAFPLPHAQSPSGYFVLPAGRDQEGCDVVCSGASYPLSLLAPVLNRPDLVRASQRGEEVPGVDLALASEFPEVSLPAAWPKP